MITGYRVIVVIFLTAAALAGHPAPAVVLYAISMLSHKQAIVIAAAGNRGPSGSPVYPAATDSAFAVTAVSIDGDAYRYANTGDYIDISAPDIDLPTTSRKVTSRTSLAVPFVTAAVARMVQVCGVSPKAAQLSLQAHAHDLGARGWDPHFGWGLLQAPRCGPTATQASAARTSRRPSADQTRITLVDRASKHASVHVHRGCTEESGHRSLYSCAATYSLGGMPSAFLNMVVNAAGLS